MHYIHKL